MSQSYNTNPFFVNVPFNQSFTQSNFNGASYSTKERPILPIRLRIELIDGWILHIFYINE